MTWTPITLAELNRLIAAQLPEAHSAPFRLWTMIRIAPEKWAEPTCGNEGGGFWAVALVGRNVVWYNDIEEGFNISPFTTAGTIDGCGYEEYELHHVLQQLAGFIDSGARGRWW